MHDTALPERIARIYNWLDVQIKNHSDLAGSCGECGRCCDFTQFDHRLFVTPPELIFLAVNLSGEKLKKMQENQCPYNADGKCTIYRYRFAGCRIFCCRGDGDFQNKLSESVLKECKSICTEFQIPYQYHDLPTALNGCAD